MIDFNKHTKLVYCVYEKHFKQYEYIKDDLCQEGLFALWKACNKFDKSRNNLFSTYAYRAIKNQMLMYLKRKELKHFNNILFSELEEKEICVENYNYCAFKDNYDFDSILKKVITNKSERNIEIFYNYFYLDKTQTQIAKTYNISPSYVSKIIKSFKINPLEGEEWK